MVRIEGVATKISLITPKLQKSVQYSPAAKKYIVCELNEKNTMQEFSSRLIQNNKDEKGNFLETEYGLCEYSDYQILSLQEATEITPFGQLPRSVDITLENDLVDKVKPGDRLSVVGIYRESPQPASGHDIGFFKAEVM